MQHRDRRVTKDTQKEQAARKKENQESLISPKSSEDKVSRKREWSTESSISTELLVFGLSSTDVPGYLKKNHFHGLLIVRVVSKCRGSRFRMH